jgi:hypothetical protein
MSTRVRKGAFAALVCALALIVAFGLDQRASAQTLLGGRAASDDMTLEINVDRPGADMFARSLPGGDVADCQQLCRETSGCTAFTFDRVDGLQAPVCRIKDAAPPPLSARCCVSGIVGAAARAPAPVAIAPPAPALLATTPAPPPRTVEIAPPLPVLALNGGIVSSWPVPVEVRDGYGRCLALGDDGLVRMAACTGAPDQRVSLRGGALSVGGRLVGPAMSAGACRTWSAQTRAHLYGLRVCRTNDGPAMMSLRESDGRREIDALQGPFGAVAPGAALVADSNAAALFEHGGATGQLRLIGAALCLASAPGDDAPGAPVYLDFCTAPAADWQGSRAAPDGRARFTPFPVR